MTMCSRPLRRPLSSKRSESPTELLVKQVAASALSSSGNRDFADEFSFIGSLDDAAMQLRTVQLLGQGVLTADIAAVKAVEKAIAGRSHHERLRIIATLGDLSATAGQSTSAGLEPLVRSAAREYNLASSLVHETRDVIGTRQTNHDFIRWVTREPDGFGRWVWSASLRAAGGRVWDRSWAQIAAQLETDSWHRRSVTRPEDERSGWRPFGESASVARKAAIHALVAASLADDTGLRNSAWQDSVLHAERACGALTWARFANEIRSEIGPATWTTTNRVIADQVAVVVNEIPWIAGYVGMIALAIEAATAPVKAAIVFVGAQALTRFADVDDALEAVAAQTCGQLSVSV